MSTKPNPLRQAMLGVQHADTAKVASIVTVVPPAPAAPPTPKMPIAPSRIGKRSVSGHVEPEVLKQLRRLAVDLERSHQSLLSEALNDLFRKYNVSAIA